MLGVGMYTTIKTLWKKGNNKSQIARATGHDWKTVDKVIKKLEKGIEVPTYKKRKSILDPYKENILKLLEKNLTALRVYEKIKDEGYKGSYSTVRRHVKGIKEKENIFMRIETPPAKEAQVDFGYVGLTTAEDGKRRKTWIFNMRLSHSRMDYYQKVYDQKVETFIDCHIKAFEYFGGVPEVVKIDNLKAAILEANFYEPAYQQLYKNFSRYYGFSPIPCRVYRPNDKGKVESGIKYVKRNFFAGRKFSSGKDLDNRLRAWNKRANRRVHGTTRKVPLAVFRSKEKPKLGPLPCERFRMPKIGTRRVYHDCHIYVGYNYYSVPHTYVGKEVDIELTDSLLRVSYRGEDIAVHPVAEGRGKFRTNYCHYPKYKRYGSTHYQEEKRAKMASIGPYAAKMFDLIVEDVPYHWGRKVAGILSLKKSYPDEVIEKSCKRAYCYRAPSYQIVKKICKNGTYTLPLEEDTYEFAKV